MPQNGVSPSISEQALHWLRLAMVRGVGPVNGRRLVQAFATPAQLWALSADDLAAVDGVGKRLIPELGGSSEAAAAELASRCREHDIGILCPEDPDWPKLFTLLDDAPLLLLYQGDCTALGGAHMLAVVGARRAGREGCLIARRWSRYLAERAVSIVSGMAFGIDAAAHGGALDAKGCTVAVLGCGLVRLTEQQQRQADAIAASGCVISEYFPKVSARPEQFPRRNRIIAGLSHATLVIEADQRSGSLITARQAADYGRDVFAVPGSVLAGNHAGCHQLIRDGAALAQHADDLMLAMGWQQSQTGSVAGAKAYRPADAREAKMLAILSGGDMHLDHLAESCGLTVSELSPILLRLELAGVVERLPGSRYLLSVELHRT